MGTTLVEAVGTDDTGAFSFTDLPAGTYTFGVAGAAGTVTAPTLVLAAGQAATGIAINVAPPPGSQAVPADDPIQPDAAIDLNTLQADRSDTPRARMSLAVYRSRYRRRRRDRTSPIPCVQARMLNMSRY